jgi:hypothetical protein
MDLINRGYDDFEQKIMDDHAGIKVFMQNGSIALLQTSMHSICLNFTKFKIQIQLVLCALDMGVATVF